MGISPRGYASGASPALRGVAPLGRAFGLASTVRGVGENPRDSGRGCRCRGSFQRSSGQWAPWDSRGGVTVMSMCSASSHTQSCMAGALDGPPPCPWLPRPRPSLRPRGGPLGSDENLHRCVVEGWRASGVAPCPKAPASALPQAALTYPQGYRTARMALQCVSTRPRVRRCSLRSARIGPQGGSRSAASPLGWGALIGPQGDGRVAAPPLPRRGGGRDA